MKKIKEVHSHPHNPSVVHIVTHFTINTCHPVRALNGCGDNAACGQNLGTTTSINPINDFVFLTIIYLNFGTLVFFISVCLG